VPASFDNFIAEAEATPIDGWDFSRFGDRLLSRPRPWDFSAIVEQHAHGSADMLDLGTGGGEWLARLDHRSARTVATESWPPNIEVAESRLGPIGVTVVPTEGAPDNTEQTDGVRVRLPFRSEEFSLITSRHESYVAAEIARVLARGGVFLTQQTGGDYSSFHRLLGLDPPPRSGPDWNLAYATAQLATAGLEVVDGAEAAEEVEFADVGAFAWYLRAIPWVIEGFSVETHRTQLLAFHERIGDVGPVSAHQPTFWLKAIKPTSS
jgi:SAM-dependent methyltransferase